MLALDLSALFFKSSRFQDTFLVAHFEEPEKFTPGEYTSDLLGYFGFGMGIYRRAEGTEPDWAIGRTFYTFPSMCQDTPQRCYEEAVYAVARMSEWYKKRGIQIDPKGCIDFLKLVAKYYRIPEIYSHYDFFEDTVMPVHDTVSFFEVNHRGEVRFGIGCVDLEDYPEDWEVFHLSEDNVHFDWHHSSQLGTPQNAMQVLRSFGSLRYSTKSAESRSLEIESLLTNLSRL